MSNRKPIAPKSIAKPAETPATSAAQTQPQTSTAATQPTTTSTPQVATPPADTPVATPSADEKVLDAAADAVPKKHRNQFKDISRISTARVRRHLCDMGINKEILEKIAERKARLDAYEHAMEHIGTAAAAEKEKLQKVIDETNPDKLKKKIKALSAAKTRISDGAPMVLAIVCEEMVKELADHACKVALAKSPKKKVGSLQVAHILSDDVRSLPLSPLFFNLPTFSKKYAEYHEKLQQESTESKVHGAIINSKRELIKELRTKGVKDLPKVAKSEKPAKTKSAELPLETEAEAQPAASNAVSKSKTSFDHYVTDVCRTLIHARPEYEGASQRADFKAFLNTCVVEFIARIAPLVYNITELMKNKTVNELAIKSAVKNLLIDGQQMSEEVAFSKTQVPDPDGAKAEHKKERDARKAGTEYKADIKSLKLVDGYQVQRSFQCNERFNALNRLLDEKMNQYYEELKKATPATTAAASESSQ